MINRDARSKSRVEEADNLRRAAAARRNWLRHDGERRTTPENKEGNGRWIYKSDGEEEVGRMMNVLSEPSRQRGSVARL